MHQDSLHGVISKERELAFSDIQTLFIQSLKIHLSYPHKALRSEIYSLFWNTNY